MALRALERWRAQERERHPDLLHETGVLWMFGQGAQAVEFARASADALRAHDAPFDELTVGEAARRYPQIRFDDISRVFIERDAGFLMAHAACEDVVRRLTAEGGAYRPGAIETPLTDLPAGNLRLTDGTTIAADAFVFACGPWLGAIFPDLLGRHLVATRQAVHYFGSPAGDAAFTDRELPVWIDFRDRQFYGIPGAPSRGFKIADDTSGPVVDPTSLERVTSPDEVAASRAFLSQRFPRLAHAPLVGSEICQYESSPDSELVIDRHPAADNVWLIGGGSGHGFKMGPAIGEMVASLVVSDSEPDPRFGIARFTNTPPKGWQEKWV
jgi:glycine/D-amino acid oxidase-like deaminating enzyme